MNETDVLDPATSGELLPPPTGQQHSNKRTDGSDGLVVTGKALFAEPSGPNAALKEPAPKVGEGVDPRHPCAGRVQIVDADRALVRETAPDGSKRKKIAICGFASTTRAYIIEACKDPGWSIWGLNQLYRHIPRADRWADIHHNWDEHVVPGTDHHAWIRDCGIPVYMLARHPQLPTSVRFPIDVLLRNYRADYFTSTIAYYVALAIWEIDCEVHAQMREHVARSTKEELEAEDMILRLRAFYGEYTIGMFGIDLTVGEEYFHEKPCAEFWLGRAVDRNIQVVIPAESALCKQQYRYGYERAPQSLIRVAELAEHKVALTKERDEQIKRLYMLEGAIECDDRWQQVAELRERGTVIGSK